MLQFNHDFILYKVKPMPGQLEHTCLLRWSLELLISGDAVRLLWALPAWLGTVGLGIALLLPTGAAPAATCSNFCKAAPPLVYRTHTWLTWQFKRNFLMTEKGNLRFKNPKITGKQFEHSNELGTS